MQLKEGMTVIAPEGCDNFLREGKSYKVFDVKEENGVVSFRIIADNMKFLNCTLKKCKHLYNKDWIIKPESDPQSLEIYKAIEESFLQNNKTLISLATNKAEIELAEFQCKSNLLNLARLELMLGIKNLTA